jgi:predicted ATPase/class 3 adenylate cyclase
MTGRRLPTGTITFLFSDMARSTRLVADLGPATFKEVLERHNEVLRSVYAAHGGVERGTQGDSFLVMFHEAPAAVEAAAEAQRALAAVEWPDGAAVRVRMGLHTGVGALGGDDYVGLDVNRAARIAGTAHGGQVLLSDAARALTETALPPGLSFRSLGEHSLRDLGRPERLFQLVIDGLPSEFPPLATPESTSRDLPQRVTSFVGRDRELDELEKLLRTCSLVTLTGPGGTGKTSLAIELARRLTSTFGDGVAWVPLESVTDPSLVEATIASRLGLIESPGQSVHAQVVEFLAGRSMLIVVDNLEHLLDAAPVLGELVRASPEVRVLATSRAPLRLAGEQEYPVAPLAIPGPVDPVEAALASPAVRLFVERSRRVRPDYELTPADAPAVAELCRRLDGLPLGIELAASRMGLLPPQELAARLGQRLDLPGSALRDVPERQRNLAAAISWSYELLGATDQWLLARLSVFAGGARLTEIEAVTRTEADLGAGVLEGLSTLVDQSLVQPVPGLDGARFRLLETIRLFAGERLVEAGEQDELRNRHARAYLVLAEEAAGYLPGGSQVPWLDRLEADHDNLRAALRWAIESGDVETAQRLGTALWRFWQIRGFIAEGTDTLNAILAMPGGDAPTTARMHLNGAAGGLAWWRADIPAATSLYTEQLALARQLGDAAGTADALFNLTHTAFAAGEDPDEVDRLRDEAIALYRQLGDRRALARARWSAGYSLMLRGRPEEAQALMRECLKEFEQLGDEFYIALSGVAQSGTSMALGDIDGAIEAGLRGLRATHAMGDTASLILGLRGATILLVMMDRMQEAATVFGAFETIARRHGVKAPVDSELLFPNGTVSEDAVTQLMSEPFAVALERGSRMSIDQVLEFIIEVLAERQGGGAMAAHAAVESSGAAAPTSVGRLVREGEVWAISFEGRTIRLRDSKGLRYLSELVSSPGRELAAVDLTAGGAGAIDPIAGVEAVEAGLSVAHGPADDVIDAEARAAYRARLIELQDDIDEAERFGDREWAAGLRDEFEAITHELAVATGLAGRVRGAPSTQERARQSVSKAIREAIDRIDRHDRDLGAHLRHAVHTGTMCLYQPDPRAPMTWEVRTG